MELPKNITQVGETDRNCKIYVEDYVVSYMRQMNKFAEEKEISIALYGKMSVEQQVTYCFVYGACMVQSIAREVRHLSQAQNQEIERMRKKYFPEQDFLGYQILNGDMIEGFRIYDQNSCRYVKGYACFFEKNDTMLAYMLEARLEEVQPEKVEQDKYDMVRRRQEERRARYEERQPGKRVAEELKAAETLQRSNEQEEEKTSKFRVLPFVVTAVVCLALLTWFGNDQVQEKVKGQLTAWLTDEKPVVIVGQEQNKELVSQQVQQSQSDNEAEKESEEEAQAVMSTLVAEDKLADAILQENENAAETAGPTQTEAPVQTTEPIQTPEPVQTTEPTPTAAPEETSAPVQTQSPEETVQRIESYIIQKGDTLIAISTRIYGNESAVSQICALNNISNPDNIQIGQKILLP